MSMTVNVEALKNAAHPQRDPDFHYTRYPEAGHTWIRACVDWKDGCLDSEAKCICPENEDHAFFIEDEAPIVAALYQVLKRRRNKPPETS